MRTNPTRPAGCSRRPSRACRDYRPKPATPEGDVKRIPLTGGLYAYVDAADYEWLSRYNWHAYNDGYAARHEKGKRQEDHAFCPDARTQNARHTTHDETYAATMNLARVRTGARETPPGLMPGWPSGTETSGRQEYSFQAPFAYPMGSAILMGFSCEIEPHLRRMKYDPGVRLAGMVQG